MNTMNELKDFEKVFKRVFFISILPLFDWRRSSGVRRKQKINQESYYIISLPQS